ncbi:hypothetical protein G6O69_24025 [Pseudenhygromyxa sp. WMMC2535]|uniref:hypothetical protein n=1 Tax=Pseudenhygromyxa sp. WMMC2535 TaxID=2712867 RepID=UPI00155755B7|nr:hypothetical protein [Pseudenhygromyxa sp. WMMC2535]NVB40929.1 hypothetical protein [Pseudenhygromyxa sp. WMMC2535]
MTCKYRYFPSASCVLLSAALVLACGGPAASDGDESGPQETDTNAGSESESEFESESDTDGPSGSCVLEGMYEDCSLEGAAGLSYCDEIEGALAWGPCVVLPECEFGESAPGCQECELLEGVPTLTGSADCSCEAPGDLPICAQSECAQRWDYGCDNCQEFVGGGTCFSYSEGCSLPLLDCSDLEKPCDRVWAWDEGLESLENGLEPAQCVLASLRDGAPARHTILVGYMGDEGPIAENVIALGDGKVIVEWVFECGGCYNFGRLGRSGVLSLQPTSYFDDCLADETEAGAVACLIGLTSADDLPEGYLPPFTTGTCDSLTPACP